LKWTRVVKTGMADSRWMKEEKADPRGVRRRAEKPD
jgi:hypothetical protein